MNGIVGNIPGVAAMGGGQPERALQFKPQAMVFNGSTSWLRGGADLDEGVATSGRNSCFVSCWIKPDVDRLDLCDDRSVIDLNFFGTPGFELETRVSNDRVRAFNYAVSIQGGPTVDWTDKLFHHIMFSCDNLTIPDVTATLQLMMDGTVSASTTSLATTNTWAFCETRIGATFEDEFWRGAIAELYVSDVAQNLTDSSIRDAFVDSETGLPKNLGRHGELAIPGVKPLFYLGGGELNSDDVIPGYVMPGFANSALTNSEDIEFVTPDASQFYTG